MIASHTLIKQIAGCLACTGFDRLDTEILEELDRSGYIDGLYR